MATATQRREVTLDTALESVDLAEEIVKSSAEALGLGADDIYKLTMAVREGVVNAYNYGNLRDPRKKITLIIESDADKMTVHILDQGSGFEPKEIPDPLAEENLLRTSGRGLFLMRTFVDEFGIHKCPAGGTDLMMAKKLPRRSSDNGSK
jgi:serine/threonine-protein kinase RsbW